MIPNQNHIDMKKLMIGLKSENLLNLMDMYAIRGGFLRTGPGDVLDDDVDTPNIKLASGPGTVMDDDVDVPNLRMATAIGKAFSVTTISFTI